MKVYPFKIPKKPKENVIFQVDRSKRFYDKLHQHQEIQLSYIISGRGKLVVGNEITTFKSGDFIGIGSNLPHLFLSHPDSDISHRASIFFTENAFGQGFFANQEMIVLQLVFKDLLFGFMVKDKSGFIEDLFHQLKNEHKFQLFLKLLELLRFVAKMDKTPLVQKPYTFRISKNQGQRLQLIFDHVMQNFQNEILLEDVAQKIHMSKNAFCRFFKQRTNKTFFQFLTEIRIQHACELLKEMTETPISEIALLSGYPSISNFNRQFKEITHMNPRTYRYRIIQDIEA